MERRKDNEAAIPEGVSEALERTLTAAKKLEADLSKFLAMAEPDVIAELSPLHRARAFLLLAKSSTALLAVRLRCSGISPDDHSMRKELERLSLYEDKLDRFTEWSKAPLRPSTKLNYQAAARFIQHSLPDLTQEQRKSMNDISRNVESGRGSCEEQRVHKKRKHKIVEKQSVRAAAQEFLEKAARELLGSNVSSQKGPLKMDNSDVEDESSRTRPRPVSY